MSMLTKTFDAIKTPLARTSPEYAEARARCPELAPYETPAAVVAAVLDSEALTRVRRDALVAAILAEHRQTRRPLWQSTLLAAFEPVLTILRRNARRPDDDEDLDQEVFLAFLDAAATVQGATHTTRALRWLTEAKLKKVTRRERRERAHASLDDETYCPPFAAEAHAKLASADVMAVIEQRGGPELLRAVIATEVEEETLDAYVARAYADRSRAQRTTLYTRLRLAKARVLAQLCARAEHGLSVAA